MPALTTDQQVPNAAPECTLCLRLAWHLTRAASVLVGMLRPIVRHQVNDDECASEGLPVGTSSPAVFCIPLSSGSPWRLDLWTETDEATRQGCLRLRLLGCDGEVWFHRAR